MKCQKHRRSDNIHEVQCFLVATCNNEEIKNRPGATFANDLSLPVVLFSSCLVFYFPFEATILAPGEAVTIVVVVANNQTEESSTREQRRGCRGICFGSDVGAAMERVSQ